MEKYILTLQKKPYLKLLSVNLISGHTGVCCVKAFFNLEKKKKKAARRKKPKNLAK